MTRLICLMVLIGCGAPPRAATPTVATTRCDYDVTLESLDTSELVVDARCDGTQVQSFIASERVMAHQIRIEGAERDGARFVLAGPARVRYRINLDDVARDNDDMDVAYKSGRAWIAAASTWLLRPYPARDDATAHIRVNVPAGARYATGMQRDGEGYWLRVADLRHATYGIFGELAYDRFELDGPMALDGSGKRALVEIVTLPGRLKSDDATRARWLRDSAHANATFWRGFPVERVCIALLPTPGRRRIVHGKVVATGGPTIVLQLGAEATRDDLYDEWVLVHELFHLGFPSFIGEGKWLDEGLATYYEPIIRARAGWRSEHALWDELISDMPQGLDAVEREGVAHTRNYRAMYWGGAIIALLADLETRQRSDGSRGLEHGLHALLAAGGDASQVWKLDDVIALVDRALGAPTLQKLEAAHAQRGSAVGFETLMQRLGVTQRDGVTRVTDDAPLTAIRRAIGGM